MYKGTVLKSTGKWYKVRNEDGDVFDCRIRGRFKLNGFNLTNPVAVGDEVDIKPEDDERAIIVKIYPRSNYVVRQSPRQKHQLHLLAANIDQAVLLITIAEPSLKQSFIDRFLLMTEPHDIPASIIFNKSDLYSEAEKSMYKRLKDIYTSLGYNVYLISALKENVNEEIPNLLEGKMTLIVGQSGVGKSTFLNALIPGLDLRTAGLSEYTGKGQHTTTFAEMYHMDESTRIIDTPGIKTLSFNNLTVMDVAHNFVEFFKLSSECKFPDCTHRNEPKCAVKDALKTGEVNELRYINYLTILDEIESQNRWELIEDL